MPPTEILEFNATQGAWEVRDQRDSDGDRLGWHAAAVRDGGRENPALYLASSAGLVYQTETSESEDEGEPIHIRALSKRYMLEDVCMAHSLWMRLDGVTADTITAEVIMGGAEYGEVSQEYSISLAGTNDIEIRTRLHRELLGRWVSVEISGAVSSMPSIREMSIRCIPIRSGRVSV